ncbi:uncharacterized protein LOC125284934 isoform X2 [Alosa alosa]|uniref:uncharacterized protein LOC121696315 isoform X2 n=1 Tax=Alosa sapidissima TaxID=34773 RepID=UPI001C082A55|nr:uncharacterized protein LOC121696315 isoform X2 [Alosa sapidissima]XP_048085053.1 uncharacterized protein LOC125284934 isoform X2 [Alosa alosa]
MCYKTEKLAFKLDKAHYCINMYHIVKFVDTEEVEVVPANWVKDGVCLWPPYKTQRILKASRCQEQPCANWLPFKVTLVHTAASYSDAHRKLSLLEDQADLHSDVEPGSSKRKREMMMNDSEDSEQMHEGMPSNAPTVICQHCGSPNDIPAMPETNSRGTDPVCTLLHNLLTNQELILEQLNVISRTIEPPQGNSKDDGDNELEPGLLPLKELDTLHDLEARLLFSSDLKHKLINTLALRGGMNVKDCVWRMMSHLLTNTLALKINWRGINGKTAFHSLQLKDVLTRAVRQNRMTSESSDMEIEAAIKRWLQLAADREGGRKARQMRQIEWMPSTPSTPSTGGEASMERQPTTPFN